MELEEWSLNSFDLDEDTILEEVMEKEEALEKDVILEKMGEIEGHLGNHS